MAEFAPGASVDASSLLEDSFEKLKTSAEDHKSEINTKIDSLIETANTKRQQMLTEIDDEVNKVREAVENKQSLLTDLKNVKSGLDADLSDTKMRDSMLEALYDQINKIDLNLSRLRLKWNSSFIRISGKIDPICELIAYTQSQFELEDSNIPLWSATLNLGKANNEIIEAKSVAIDRETGDVYVGDACGKKILIFNKVGDFIRTLVLAAYPSAIGRMVVHGNSIYCHNNSFLPSTIIYKLDKTTGIQSATYNARSHIKGIAIWGDSVYTGAHDLSNLNILTLDLTTVKLMPITSLYMKKSIILSSILQDMVVVDGEIVLLIANCDYPLQVFDLSAALLRYVKLDKYSAVLDAFLCIDQHWNIMVSTNHDKLVRIYDKQGKAIGSVGRQGQDKDGMYYPRGIVLDTDNNLIVCSCKKQFLLQAY